ncbi:MAG: DNA repair protein RecN [Deltaproteobacteria bacterium]|nr:DNA repair protein RecN [Deltaproteobacteria bacterium]
MLVQLNISNFAIISHLDIHFRPGLNILSGETGAGKSIIINAVNLILGSRASSELIRTGFDEARVEALFEPPDNPSIRAFMTELGLPFEGEILIRRHISREGRNRIEINGSIATLQTLSRLGALLISISGQHEHQLLLRPESHLHLLDDFGELAKERESLSEDFASCMKMKEERRVLEGEIRSARERQELEAFQIREIEQAAIKEGEDALLEEEKRRLQHAEQIRELLQEAYHLLYEKEAAVLSDLSRCVRGVEKALDMDGRLAPVRNALESARVELEEAALELRDLRRGVAADPYRLEEVEERLRILHKLKRKYGPGLEEVLRFKAELSSGAESLEQKRFELERITGILEGKQRKLMEKARSLSEKRKKAAKDMEGSVERELRHLGMGRTRFEIRFYREEARPDSTAGDTLKGVRADGMDRVEFMLSPNVGEELKPLSRIASGGELSRIMLALKTILARTASVETIIFDEIDSGIGGATAEVVGEKLQSLAGFHQILCISHLPQIASKGGTHFLVKKEIVEERTQTLISELSPEERITEIARLLGGKRVSRQALEHAREILS